MILPQQWALSAIITAALLVSACGGGGAVRSSSEDKTNRAAEVNTQLGGAYLQRGQYEQSLEKLEKAINYDPDYAAAHSTIAILYEQIGEVSKAETHHRRAVRLDPKDANAQNNLGAFLCKIGKYRESEEYFVNAASNAFYHTPEQALTNAGKCLQRATDNDKAERYFRQALTVKPNFPDALFSLAELNLHKGESLRARAFLQRYETVAPVSPDSLLLGYRIERAMGADSDAESYAQKLRAQYPNTPQASQLQAP
jgi:type IV pilus assembly protein PilF